MFYLLITVYKFEISQLDRFLMGLYFLYILDNDAWFVNIIINNNYNFIILYESIFQKYKLKCKVRINLKNNWIYMD